MKLTPWFPASVKPVRPGWYEGRFDLIDGTFVNARVCFDGISFEPVEIRGLGEMCLGVIKGDQWRGLTKPAR